VHEINASSDEQARGVEQITKAVQQLDQVIQQNASVAEEMASTSEEMSSQAANMQQNVALFLERLGGQKSLSQGAGGWQRTLKRQVKVAHLAKGGQAKPEAVHHVAPRGNSGLRPEPGVTSHGEGVHLQMGDAADKEFERYDA
jgi:methyl-accepting chemotaxis protein